MLKLAEHNLDSKRGEFDPSTYEDHYETALVEMLRKKQAGFRLPRGKERPATPKNVVSLMDALRQSIAEGRRTPAAGKASAGAAAGKKGKKRVAGQSEMLLPIEGKKTKEAAKKVAARPAGRRKAG
jgi:DNA end-binding protein Ku